MFACVVAYLYYIQAESARIQRHMMLYFAGYQNVRAFCDSRVYYFLVAACPVYDRNTSHRLIFSVHFYVSISKFFAHDTGIIAYGNGFFKIAYKSQRRVTVYFDKRHSIFQSYNICDKSGNSAA